MCSPDELITTALRMVELGLVTGSFGNLSCRQGERILITPTSLDYSLMKSEDIVTLDPSGKKIVGLREPSSEFRLHLEIYRIRSEIQAIVHTHSLHALSLSLIATELPALTEEMEQGVGGSVPVVPYAPAGSRELAEQAAEALLVCRLVERNAKVYLRTHTLPRLGKNGPG